MLVLTALVAGALAWWVWGGGEEAAITRRLTALTDHVNSPAGEGLGAVAHAVEIGSYFTEDAVIELGPGTSPIQGRQMLVGMSARLQPRLAVFRLALDDIGVELAEDGSTADVRLTASFTTRRPGAGQDSMDARELALVMRQDGGSWRIARITPVETLR